MAWAYFVINLIIPLLHTQFVKNQLRGRKKVYGFNSDTLEVMYVGSISGIVISFTILLSEIIGLDIQMGSTGFLFAIFTSFLIYELYIQKSSELDR